MQGWKGLDTAARAQIERSAAAIGARIARSVAQLISHRDPLVRGQAISVYAKLAAPDREEQIQKCLEDPVAPVQLKALEALGLAYRLNFDQGPNFCSAGGRNGSVEPSPLKPAFRGC